MRHAYLIMAHGDFYLLKKLIKAIDNPDGDIFLHLDANRKYSEEMIREIKGCAEKSKLTIYSKLPILWGGWSQVKCELYLIQQAVHGNYGFYHLLSGQDFLLRPIQEIQTFFDANAGKEFLAVDNWPLSREAMIDRIDQYHFMSKNRHITMAMNRFTSPLQHLLGIHLAKRKDVECFAKGMNWASMTHAFVSCLLNEEERIMKIAQHALCFDEIYKQMVFNEHKGEFELYQEIKSPNETKGIPRYSLEVLSTMHKVDWARGTPYVYRSSDFNELIHSPCMFARKFNSDVDKEIIDHLFEYVMQEKNQGN